ncbi:MAG: exosome protein [Methanomassiliicoccales archaeon]|nr:MAG: exosome protein [Methanomassiliicoccales archaeon]
MTISSVYFRTFVHATEDEGKVLQALKNVSGLDEYHKDVTTGYHGNKILVLEGNLKDKKAIKRFFSSFSKDDIRALIDTIESRVDDECQIFARIDKQKAYLGELVLTKGDDIISVRGKVQTYPKKREVAIRNVTEFLEKLADGKD